METIVRVFVARKTNHDVGEWVIMPYDGRDMSYLSLDVWGHPSHPIGIVKYHNPFFPIDEDDDLDEISVKVERIQDLIKDGVVEEQVKETIERFNGDVDKALDFLEEVVSYWRERKTMKRVELEVTKKFEHIIGQEFKEVVEVRTFAELTQLSNVNYALDLMEPEDHLTYRDELKNIYALKDGVYYLDLGDFEITLRVAPL